MNRFARSSTPPPREHISQQLLSPPLTPGAPLPKTFIPPSPGGPLLVAPKTPKSTAKLRSPPLAGKHGKPAGVEKTSRTAKIKSSVVKAIETFPVGKETIKFLDLPGEIRNMIYTHTSDNNRQALLVHRPRIASLRPRTRLDRQRTLHSDVVDKEQDRTLADGSRSHVTQQRRSRATLLARETNRPFVGLTQVCRLLRQEFRPLYMQKQEVGMDIVDVNLYLRTFYPEAAGQLQGLSTSRDRKVDMPFTGNMTIAVSDKCKPDETSADGIDVLPLLDIWANSYKIEAGFGRYMQMHYDATADGEAKDLYRLFGRRVQPDRKCSPMNIVWRTILRTRVLAAVKIHRQPAGSLPAPLPAPVAQTAFHIAQQPVATGPRPYIHMLFIREHAEGWMNQFESAIPQDWLRDRGFDSMEYFTVKVGVAPAAGK